MSDNCFDSYWGHMPNFKQRRGRTVWVEAVPEPQNSDCFEGAIICTWVNS